MISQIRQQITNFIKNNYFHNIYTQVDAPVNRMLCEVVSVSQFYSNMHSVDVHTHKAVFRSIWSWANSIDILVYAAQIEYYTQMFTSS